jgi:regulator of protease activity HflC (stomatin/prohibitin superfamily)
MKLLPKLFLSLFAITTLATMTGCASIGPGNVGIEFSKAGSVRGPSDVALKYGFNLYNPMWTDIIEYPVSMQTVQLTKDPSEGSSADESITFTTGDSSTVNADISISYQLQTDKAADFYIKFRADDIKTFTYGFLRNVVRDAFNEAAGHYTVEQVMGDNAKLLHDVHSLAQAQLSMYGIQIEQLGFIGAPRPPVSVVQSINLKVQATQIALQKQIEVTQAEAEAKKTEAIATGEASANITRATADATANRLRNESLTPQLLEWTKIQKWDGHNPNVVSGPGGGLIVKVQ